MSTKTPIWANVVAVVLVGGIIGYVVWSSTRPNDAADRAACQDFRALQADSDLVTPTEARERIADIWERAQIANNPEVRSAAREMLSAITSGSGLAAAVLEMDAACSDIEA